MSRLKREGNPPSNQLASPVPQAWDPSINDFREITGQNLGGGRFGTDGVQWGKTASGLFMPIRVTNDGVQEVQLSGTVAKLIAYDKKMWDELINYTYGFAGVDSSGIFSVVDAQKDRIIDISEFSEISILIINNLNKALENQTSDLGTSGKVVFSTLPKTLLQTLIPSYRFSHLSGEYILFDPIPAGARLSLRLADMAPYQSLAVMVTNVHGVSAGSLEIMIGGGLK